MFIFTLIKYIIIFILAMMLFSFIRMVIAFARSASGEESARHEHKGRPLNRKDRDKVIELDKDQYKVE